MNDLPGVGVKDGLPRCARNDGVSGTLAQATTFNLSRNALRSLAILGAMTAWQ